MVGSDVDKCITNPLNAFLLIKRTTSDIKLIEHRFPEESKLLIEKIEFIQPEAADLTGAVEGLLRLQTIYKLSSKDFANGIVDGKKTIAALSAHDLFVIGEEAYKLNNQDFFAKEYFNLVREMIKSGRDADKEVDEKNLLLMLSSSYHRTGEYNKAVAVANELIAKFPGEEDFKILKQSFLNDQREYGTTRLKLTDPFSDYYVKDGKFSQIKEDTIFSQVCRGNITKSPFEASQLHCRYMSKTPFAKLARFKIEEANLEPYLILVLDAISDSEIEFLKEVTKPKIKRAATRVTTKERKISNVRVAQLSWHFDNSHEIFERLSRRVEVF